MKRVIVFLFVFICGVTVLFGQTAASRADDLLKQAKAQLEQNEYVKARSIYLKAYEQYAGIGNYAKLVECGLKVSSLYRREGLYNYANQLCIGVDYQLMTGEKKNGNSMPALRFLLNEERMQLAIAQKKADNARYALSLMENNAKAAKNDTINDKLLYVKTIYYYSFGMNKKGDESFGELINKYKEQNNREKLDEVYRNFIESAVKADNAPLVARIYKEYTDWKGIETKLANEEAQNRLQAQHQADMDALQDKEDSLVTKQYIIVGLCVLAALLIAALILTALVLLRYVLLTRKQKKTIHIADEHAELKNHFIRNISAQIEPTLDTLDDTLPGVKALRTFSAHIQELSELENSLSETYEMSTINVNTFCEELIDKAKPFMRADVTATVNAPKLAVKANPEQLERILLHLLTNAAEFTPKGGKIWIDYKKRGAHTQQFIISDTGPGVPEELQDNLFKPFTEVRDLIQGDGLGLPICSLIAAKMNGTLTIDKEYKRGCRFVLELHP
ncbi:MAG: sensor histidine kinase [Prevotellaceae bacterium]|jgi:signal transduction histidine kinase|nr:sensor histidine kinase [Prevotellaceae bacterium]